VVFGLGLALYFLIVSVTMDRYTALVRCRSHCSGNARSPSRCSTRSFFRLVGCCAASTADSFAHGLDSSRRLDLQIVTTRSPLRGVFSSAMEQQRGRDVVELAGQPDFLAAVFFGSHLWSASEPSTSIISEPIISKFKIAQLRSK